MSNFAEVADRVWVARYEWFDVNVTVVAGSAGLLVVDTNASAPAARAVLADLRRLSTAPLVAAVNTKKAADRVASRICNTGIVVSLISLRMCRVFDWRLSGLGRK